MESAAAPRARSTRNLTLLSPSFRGNAPAVLLLIDDRPPLGKVASPPTAGEHTFWRSRKDCSGRLRREPARIHGALSALPAYKHTLNAQPLVAAISIDFVSDKDAKPESPGFARREG